MPKQPGIPSLFPNDTGAPHLDSHLDFQMWDPPSIPDDAPARRAAIDTTRSILVQAPAGAGKTNLLTQRFLALLAEVDEPEQILAITFTRAATAEMRQRIVQALERARQSPEPRPAEGDEMPLARAALRRADALGWRLLEQPHRLDVQTIDSLCLRLAHGQPLLARLGGALQPTEDAAALYATAARRTMMHLGAQLGPSHEPDLQSALRTLLLRRDNNLGDCERLLAAMLARRDAWLGVLPLAPATTPGETVDWAVVRERLEQPFADESRRVLHALHVAFAAMPELARSLLEAARYAAANLGDAFSKGLDLRRLRSIEELPGESPEHREHWLAIASLLLTQRDEWRKSWRETEGFPPAGAGAGPSSGKDRRVHSKRQIQDCCEGFQAHPRGGAYLLQRLCQLRALPAPHYSDDQWRTLRAVFLVLRRAAAELRLVFAEANAVDFVEIAQAADAVLRDETGTGGLLASERKRHLLIDEFQDTSRAQYRLVAELLREWSEGDGRTVFLVGDPLQSIYGFRQAEVALFHQTREHGLPCGAGRHRCHALRLTHNFRAHRALVEQLNARFAKMFAGSPAEVFADTFVAAQAWPLAAPAGPEPAPGDSFHLHTFFVDRDADRDAAQDRKQAQRQEAAAVVRVLAAELPRIAAVQRAAERAAQPGLPSEHAYRVAVLVRSRGHLAAILPALRAAAIPYRAVELEPLAERPEVHDLLMLLRALLHPADRVAWLTVLRGPWCGLLLPDLHALTGHDDPELLRQPVSARIEASIEAGLLSPDGHARLARTWGVLCEALRTRYSDGNSLSLSAWLERTWMALGGPACVDEAGRENAEAFLRLLDEFEPSGVEVFRGMDGLRGDFAQRLAKLCAAPDPRVGERFGVQLMTMHKAKGLGFEVVLLPGLERKPRGSGAELLAMLDRTGQAPDSPEGDGPLHDELLLAPIGNSDDGERDRTYSWVMRQKAAREAGERKRLFYVACTRARTRLHLFATLDGSRGALRAPDERSLLGAAWPALGDEIEARWSQQAGAGLALAAAAETEAAQEPAGAQPQTIERLPAAWAPTPNARDIATAALARSTPPKPLFPRGTSSTGTTATLAARIRGVAMHALLENLAGRFARESGACEPELWRRDLERTAARLLRAGAFPNERLRHAAAELTGHALAAAASSTGRWLLAPHPGALAESAWQSWDADGNLRTLRVDRCFLAGEAPGTSSEHYLQQYLWIVDYKTGAHPERLADYQTRAAWLAEQKQAWRPQLEAYGAALAAAGGPLPSAGGAALRYGLFFPELLELVSWTPA